MLNSPCRFEFIRAGCVILQRFCRAKFVLAGSTFFCGFGFNRTMLAGRWVCFPNEFELTAFGMRACQ